VDGVGGHDIAEQLTGLPVEDANGTIAVASPVVISYRERLAMEVFSLSGLIGILMYKLVAL
jgi:hypothetical protein